MQSVPGLSYMTELLNIMLSFGEDGPDAGELVTVEVDMPVDVYGFIDVELAVEALAGVVISAVHLGEFPDFLGKVRHVDIAAEWTLLPDIHVAAVERDPSDGVEHAGL